jgi:hypothetical protein
LGVIFTIVIELLLAHHDSTVVTDKVAVFDVLIDMFGSVAFRWFSDLHDLI